MAHITDVVDDRATGDGVTQQTADRRPGGSEAPTAPSPHHLPYNPALDGIRAISVLAVMLFHAGFPWARGGYLGVSTFFTLSGFLITSLALREHRATGRISPVRFWARRARRLLPASAATLAAVALGARVFDTLQTPGLRGDLLGALFHGANWRFLVDGQSYGDVFAEPSPVLHFWSLAIEEQFYWLFPLLAAGVLAVSRGSVKVFAAVLTGLVGVSLVATLALGTDEADTVYYATYTRMGEILLGSLLAVAVAAGLTASALVRRLAAAGGAVALAAILWAWWNVEQGSASVSQGGLLAYGLVSTALVLAAWVPGPIRRGLAVAPLRGLGVISYGVYLVHWPIFLVLDGRRTGLDRVPLFALRLAVTLAVAVASYRLLEQPIRRGWSFPRVPMPALAAGMVAAVALVAATAPVARSGFTAEELAYLEGIKFQDPANIPPTARLGIAFGDSTMLRTGLGLSAWGNETEHLVLPGTVNDMSGCGVSRGGERRSRGETVTAPTSCDGWEQAIPGTVADLRERFGRLEFAIVQTGPWDIADRRLDGDDTWRAPGDPVYDEFLYGEIADAADAFLAEGLVVVWLLSPHIEPGANEEPPPDPPYAESDPARVDRLNEIIRRVADERDGVVTIDVGAHLRGLPGGEMDPDLRPDGVHFSEDSAREIADWLGPEVLAAVAAEPNPLAPPPAPPAG